MGSPISILKSTREIATSNGVGERQGWDAQAEERTYSTPLSFVIQ